MSTVTSSPAKGRRGSLALMIDQSHGHHPLVAAVTLLAAAMGASAGWLGDHLDPHPLVAAARLPESPDELFAWAKAIANSLFVLVNAMVGSYHVLAIGHSTIKRRRRRPSHPKTPAGPAPVADGAGGNGSAGA